MNLTLEVADVKDVAERAGSVIVLMLGKQAGFKLTTLGPCSHRKSGAPASGNCNNAIVE